MESFYLAPFHSFPFWRIESAAVIFPGSTLRVLPLVGESGILSPLVVSPKYKHCEYFAHFWDYCQGAVSSNGIAAWDSRCFEVKSVFPFVLNSEPWIRQLLLERTVKNLFPVSSSSGSHPAERWFPPPHLLFYVLSNNCDDYARHCFIFFLAFIFYSYGNISILFCTLLFSLTSVSWDVNNLLLFFTYA